MRNVALLIETSGSYGRGLLQGVQRYVDEHGSWSISFELRGLDSRPPGWLKHWKGDGILTRTGSRELAKAIARLNVPAVELRTNRYLPKRHFVGIDNISLGKQVASHFLDRGFRHFGVYRYDIEDYFIVRSDSFINAVLDSGYYVESINAPAQIDDSRVWNQHQLQLVEWLRKLPKPIGLMACNDQMGYWLLNACRQAGILVPEEVAIVGADNDETLCSLSSPPLSSIPHDAQRIGYKAAWLLDQLMAGNPTTEDAILIPPLPIVMRRSSDVLAIDDSQLAMAIQLIRRSACLGHSVNEVLREVPISRSMLERKMREYLGRSPHEEMMRVRLERATHLLRSTELPLDQIAAKSGFSTAQYFCTVFQKMMGSTPIGYRKLRLRT
ncbi:substrate-binding domain-containing protein [Planctomicrobium sp. SH527]|uniref:XylR family transcriptional regulator n=1 Tax=Planctomicrobium sp. SH527 TaxID=3448123 RepID=UPI003F5B7AA2